MKKFYTCIVLHFVFINCSAQITFTQAFSPILIEPDGLVDTFKQKEVVKIRRQVADIKFPEKEQDSSTFKYLQQASNFIKNADTPNAHKYLLKTTPHHIHSLLELTATPLDSFITHYCLVGENKELFLNRQQAIKRQPNSRIYDSLKRIYFNILRTRREFDSVSGRDKPTYERHLIKTDSIQFALLRAYITRSGWPTLANGSLFAAEIALRDREYYFFYIPYLKEAFVANQVPLYAIKKILVNDTYYYNYVRLQKCLQNPYKVYDVTTFKDNFTYKFLESPSLTKEIIDDIKAHDCEFEDFFFVYYANNVISAGNKFLGRANGNTDCSKIWDEVDNTCPHFLLSSPEEGNGPGMHYYLPNYQYKTDKEFFYVIYKRK